RSPVGLPECYNDPERATVRGFPSGCVRETPRPRTRGRGEAYRTVPQLISGGHSDVEVGSVQLARLDRGTPAAAQAARRQCDDLEQRLHGYGRRWAEPALGLSCQPRRRAVLPG